MGHTIASIAGSLFACSFLAFFELRKYARELQAKKNLA